MIITYKRTQLYKATICTFAHSHICTFTKHLHIHQAFAHSHICTFAHLLSIP